MIGATSIDDWGAGRVFVGCELDAGGDGIVLAQLRERPFRRAQAIDDALPLLAATQAAGREPASLVCVDPRMPGLPLAERRDLRFVAGAIWAGACCWVACRDLAEIGRSSETLGSFLDLLESSDVELLLAAGQGLVLANAVEARLHLRLYASLINIASPVELRRARLAFVASLERIS